MRLWLALAALPVVVMIPGCSGGSAGRPPVIWDKPHPAGETVERRIGRYTVRLYNDNLNSESQSVAQLFLGDRLVWTRTGYRFFLAPCDSEDCTYDLPTPKERLEEVCGRDINGDGWPELVIMEWSGGAHAAYTYWILSLQKQPVELIELSLGSGQLAISDLNYDGVPELLAHNYSFAYWHECFAASPAPTMIFQWRNGRYELATRDFISLDDPHLKRRRAKLPELMADWRLTVGDGPGWAPEGEPASLPPTELWSLMLDYIHCGEGRAARQLVEECWDPTIRGKAEFLKEFDAKLRRGRFWMLVEAMTPKAKRWTTDL